MNEPTSSINTKLSLLTQSLISEVQNVKEGMSITLALLNAIIQDLTDAQELLLQEHSDRSRILNHYTAVGIELGAVLEELNEYQGNELPLTLIVENFEKAAILFQSPKMLTWVEVLKDKIRKKNNI